MTTKLYYYRPLAAYPEIYKCAGHGAEDPQHRAFYEPFFNSKEDCKERGFVPGVVILEGYRGDRIVRYGEGWQHLH
jgi:hypothetical protein